MNVAKRHSHDRIGNFAGTLNAHQSAQDTAREILSIGRLESPIQESARLLYNTGMNVFPLLYGNKRPCYKWSRMITSRLHPTHEQYGLHAVFAGRCNIGVMTGGTSGDLAVIDAETMESFEGHIEQLQAKGIPLYSSLSSRGGHIWLRIAEGVANSIAPGIMPGSEFRSANLIVVAPPSVHPTGAIYQWHIRETVEPPIVSIHDLNWFVDANGKPITVKLRQKSIRQGHKLRESQIYSPYSRKTQEYIKTGSSLPEGVRNTSGFSAACDLKGNGVPETDTRAIVVPIATASGLPSDEAHRIVTNAYSKAREPARKHQSKTLNRQLVTAFVDTHQWPGQTGITDRAVMLAFVERDRIGGNANGTFRASYRELAELTRCSVNTVRSAVDRLKSAIPAPFIFYAGTDKISHATIWRFSDYVLSTGRKHLLNDAHLLSTHVAFDDSDMTGNSVLIDTLQSNQLGLRSSVSIGTHSDASERGALGKTGLLVYQTMIAAGEPLTVKEIAKRSGLTINQVRRALSGVKRGNTHSGGWLLKSGIVECQGRCWIAYPATDEQLDERIARPAGKLGAGEKRRQAFKDERAINLGQYILTTRMKYDRRGLWGDRAVDLPTPAQQNPVVDPLIAEGLALGAEITTVSPLDSVDDQGEIVQESVMILEKTG